MATMFPTSWLRSRKLSQLPRTPRPPVRPFRPLVEALEERSLLSVAVSSILPVSVDTSGQMATVTSDNGLHQPASTISADGRYLVFTSYASPATLLGSGTDGNPAAEDVYL